MDIENKRTFLKRTIYITVFLIILAIILVMLNDDFLGILAPLMFGAFFSLATIESVSFLEIILVIIFSVISLIPYILLGGLLSYIYGKIKFKKTAIVIFLILLIIVSLLLININKNPVYGSVEDCEKITDAWYSSYKDYKPQCYLTVAKRSFDLEICNKIEESDYKTRCSEDVNKLIERFGANPPRNGVINTISEN